MDRLLGAQMRRSQVVGRNDRCEKRRFAGELACELVVKRFSGEIALRAATVLAKPAVKKPLQPLGDERRHNAIDVFGGVANRERRPRAFGTLNAQHRRHYELDTRKLQISAVQGFHAAPPETVALSNACRSIFPVPVLGISGRNATKRGYL